MCCPHLASFTVYRGRSTHPESTEACCGRPLIYAVVVALESTEGFILAGKWDQSCNYSPLAGMPLSGLSYIRNRPSFLKLSKTMRSMKIAPTCEEEACTISCRGNCIGAQVSMEGRWSSSPCIISTMAKAGSLGFRVICKTTFESNLPAGGFPQKDFSPDF